MTSLRKSTKTLVLAAIVVVILSVFFVKIQTPGRTAVKKAEYYKDLYYSYQRLNKNYDEYRILAEQYYDQALFELREVLDKDPKNAKAIYWLDRAHKVKTALDNGDTYYNPYGKAIFYGVSIFFGVIVLVLIITAAGRSIKRKKYLATGEGMVCPECYAPVEEDDKSCRNCGAEFEEDAENNRESAGNAADASGDMPDEHK